MKKKIVLAIATAVLIAASALLSGGKIDYKAAIEQALNGDVSAAGQALEDAEIK